MYGLSYRERLYNLGLDSLELIRLRSDLPTYYKIIHRFVDPSVSDFFHT